ncbi:MAG: ABC transporter ATP-binding protein [Thermoplasmatota archaeon]
MDRDHIIRANALTKEYGSLKALRGIQIGIPGGSTGLLGPNGAGKSTFIKCILGLIVPTSGSSEVLGKPSSAFSKGLESREKVGYVPENECLEPELDAVSFVRYMGELSGLPPMEAMQRSHEVLDYVDIQEQRYRPIRTYSTGMRQKVKLAQALVHDPELIVLDEPTNGMDPKGRQEMLDLIKEVSGEKGKNVLLSSHLLPDVEYICEHVMIMNQGQVVVAGDIEELTRPSNRYEIRIKGSPEIFEETLIRLGLDHEKSGSFYHVEAREGLLMDLYKELAKTDVQIRHATMSRMSLEDIFVSNLQEVPG